jgi:hypothetical protein
LNDFPVTSTERKRWFVEVDEGDQRIAVSMGELEGDHERFFR